MCQPASAGSRMLGKRIGRVPPTPSRLAQRPAPSSASYMSQSAREVPAAANAGPSGQAKRITGSVQVVGSRGSTAHLRSSVSMTSTHARTTSGATAPRTRRKPSSQKSSIDVTILLMRRPPNACAQRPRASIASPGPLEREVMGLIASPPSRAPDCLRASAGRPHLSGRPSGQAPLSRSARRPSLSLELSLQLVEEAPVRALGDNLLRARLDHPRLVEAEGVEAHRVLRIVDAPLVVGNILHGRERIVVARREPAVDEGPSGPFRLEGAEGGRLQDRPQRSLGGDRMFANELPVARGHAAKVLRPRPVDRAVDDDVSEFPGAELLRVRRKCEVGVDLPLREQPLALGGRMLGEGDVLGSSPTWASMLERKTCAG